MPILLLEAPDFSRGVVPFEEHEQTIERRGPTAASFDRDAENLVAVVNHRTPYRFGRRDLELGRQRLGRQAGGLIQNDRGSDGHIANRLAHGAYVEPAMSPSREPRALTGGIE